MAAASLFLAALASFQVTAPETPEAAEAEAVAEEIVRIREALGGSIVETPPVADGRDAVGAEDAPRTKRRRPRPPKREDPVALLRRTALRLDLAAHRLEVVELYKQADRIRSTAHGLRLSARELAGEVSRPATPGKPQD